MVDFNVLCGALDWAQAETHCADAVVGLTKGPRWKGDEPRVATDPSRVACLLTSHGFAPAERNGRNFDKCRPIHHRLASPLSPFSFLLRLNILLCYWTKKNGALFSGGKEWLGRTSKSTSALKNVFYELGCRQGELPSKWPHHPWIIVIIVVALASPGRSTTLTSTPRRVALTRRWMPWKSKKPAKQFLVHMKSTDQFEHHSSYSSISLSL